MNSDKKFIMAADSHTIELLKHMGYQVVSESGEICIFLNNQKLLFASDDIIDKIAFSNTLML